MIELERLRLRSALLSIQTILFTFHSHLTSHFTHLHLDPRASPSLLPSSSSQTRSRGSVNRSYFFSPLFFAFRHPAFTSLQVLSLFVACAHQHRSAHTLASLIQICIASEQTLLLSHHYLQPTPTSLCLHFELCRRQRCSSLSPSTLPSIIASLQSSIVPLNLSQHRLPDNDFIA